MKIYFEDGPLVNTKYSQEVKVIVDAAFGLTANRTQLNTLKQQDPNTIIYTNSLIAFSNEYAWSEELQAPEVYIRAYHGKYVRIDKLTRKALRKEHNLAKLYLGGAFTSAAPSNPEPSSKVYVVTSGQYSDYHIITATIDEALAKRIQKRFEPILHATVNIETFENTEILLKPFYHISFDSKGNVVSSEDVTAGGFGYKEDITTVKGDNLHIWLYADDLQTAIKIAAERRAKYLSEAQALDSFAD